jgi:hypothetical protein
MSAILKISLISAVLGLSLAVPVSAQNRLPPPPPFSVTPNAPPAYSPLYEGRSVYRRSSPGAFYNSPDEKGYNSGLAQNPQTGE